MRSFSVFLPLALVVCFTQNARGSGAGGLGTSTLPSVQVEDPSQCLNTKSLAAELAQLLPAEKDHHQYAVGVVVTAAKDAQAAQVQVTVEHANGGVAPVERKLTVQRSECADAVRVVARMAASAMEGAPNKGEPKSNALGGRGGEPASSAPAKASVPDRVPDDYISFEHRVEVNVSTSKYGSNVQVNEYDVPVMGPYKKQLEWPELYRKTAHPDLAKTYEFNVNRWRAAWAGISVASL